MIRARGTYAIVIVEVLFALPPATILVHKALYYILGFPVIYRIVGTLSARTFLGSSTVIAVPPDWTIRLARRACIAVAIAIVARARAVLALWTACIAACHARVAFLVIPRVALPLTVISIHRALTNVPSV